jgi:hypothetical protein
MATHIGNNGSVKIGANTVAEVTAWSLSEASNTSDDTVIGDTSQSHLVGTLSWSGSVTCYWDETDATGQEAMTAGASVDLHLLPDGATTGDIDFNGTATITGIERSVGLDSTVTASFSFTGNGDLTRDVLA